MKFDVLASKDTVKKTIESLKARNINAEFVNSKEEALKIAVSSDQGSFKVPKVIE